jgi:uncharacterized protein (DUF1330 family)
MGHSRRWLLGSLILVCLPGCGPGAGKPAGPAPVKKIVVAPPRNTPKAPPTVPQMTAEERAKAAAAMLEAVPDFSLKAETYYDDYQRDKQAAFKKYFGKVVELSGVVESMGQDPRAGRSFIHLRASEATHGVQCITLDPEPWATVSPGQTVRLKGTWPKETAVSTATLGDCVFVKKGPNPAIAISAVDLAKEYAADKDAAIKKYENKYLIVDGEIVHKETISKRGTVTVALTGDGGVRVACFFTFVESVQSKPLQVGQRIKLIGTFVKPEETRDVTLSTCLLITN